MPKINKQLKSTSKLKANWKKEVTWKRVKKSGEVYFFNDIKTSGWVPRYEKLNLGLLQNVRETGGKIIFEFVLNGRRFDASSPLSNEHGKENKKLLKKNHTYIIKGSINASPRTEKYERGSGSTARLTLFLGGIEVVHEEKEKTTQKVDTVDYVKGQLQAGKYFTTGAMTMTIEGGDLYRYLGCGTCKAGVKRGSFSKRGGKFNCGACKKTCDANDIMAYIIIKNLKLKDATGSLSGLVAFHNEAENIFGKEVMEKLSNALSDSVGKEEFRKLIGQKIKATLSHQRAENLGNGKLLLKDCKMVKRREANKPVAAPPALVSECLPEQANVDENDEVRIRKTGIICRQCASEDNDENDGGDDEILGEEMDSGLENDAERSESDRSEAYQLSLTPEGHCGLAMIVNIDSKTQRRRPGSSKDVEALERIFPTFGIKVFNGKAIWNMLNADFEREMERFKTELLQGNYSSCFLVFMGHGVQNSVFLADATKINVFTDIMKRFSGRDFPAFYGKPKIFLFQSCQNVYYEQEPELESESDSNNTPGQARRVFDFPLKASMAHTMWLTPCMPGQSAKRHPEKGSYFIQTFVKCLEKYGDKLELYKIFYKVQGALERNPRYGKHYYLPEIHSVYFGSFYFPIK